MRTWGGIAGVLVCVGCAATTTPVTQDGAVDSRVGMDTTLDQGVDGGTDAPGDGTADTGGDRGTDAPTADLPQVDTATTDLGPLDAPDAATGCGAAPPLPPAVCVGLCGNGRRDTCMVCGPCLPGGGPPPFPDAGPCCTSQHEVCDGADLGGATCASLGYASGTLACTAMCGADATGCDGCATGPNLAACTRADVTVTGATSLALATAGGDVGAAWVLAGVAHFVHVGSDLRRVGDVTCFGPNGAVRVALAAVSGGWLAAVETPGGTEVYPLSPSGAATGPVVSFPGAGRPLMAGRAGAGPLLLWTTTGGAEQGVVLGTDGRPGTAAVTYLGNTVEPEYGSATAVGAGFLVALRTDAGVQVVPVDAAGRPGAPASLGASTEYPQLAEGQARLTWADFGASPARMNLANLDPGTGRVSGAVTSLGAIPTYYNPCPAAGVGDATVVLLGGYTGGTARAGRLDAVTVSAMGTSVGTPFHVNQEPVPVISYRVIAHGADVVAGWLSTDVPGRLGLARVVP